MNIFEPVQTGNTAGLKKAIHHYGDINNRMSALHVATLYNNLEMAKELLNHDADTNIKDDNGQTPLYLATKNNKDRCRVKIG